MHNCSHIEADFAVEETMRITGKTTEKLHKFAFNLAPKRRAAGKPGAVTCVDKANIFNAIAFSGKYLTKSLLIIRMSKDLTIMLMHKHWI